MPLATQLVCPTSSISQPISFCKATEVQSKSKPPFNYRTKLTRLCYPELSKGVKRSEHCTFCPIRTRLLKCSMIAKRRPSFRSSNQRENKLRCVHKSILEIYFIYPHAWCHYHPHPPPPQTTDLIFPHTPCSLHDPHNRYINEPKIKENESAHRAILYRSITASSSRKT